MIIGIDQIKNNLEMVTGQIKIAASASGRDPSSVHLLVVTKAQPLEKVQAAYGAGARLFGENYPEETVSKIQAMQEFPGIEWHMIGHLQSRKVRIVAEYFTMLHSLDRLSVAEKLDRSLSDFGRTMPVLLEVNVSGEESKFGLPAWQEDRWEELLPTVEKILSLPHLQLQGLMTMPPLSAQPDRVRPYFARIRRLREYLISMLPQGNWQHLSMGTSADFAVAIQEGATYIRVGQAIVGQRPSRVDPI